MHAVPSAVTGLQVEDLHSTHSLQVSWEEARGVSDGYVLQLLDDRGSLVTNCSLAFGETRHRVEGLTAGRKYRVQVQTTSGGVHSQRVSTEARTCKTSYLCFTRKFFSFFTIKCTLIKEIYNIPKVSKM